MPARHHAGRQCVGAGVSRKRAMSAGNGTKRLLIVGASGHARVVADIARRMGSLAIAGVCNRSGTGELEGIPVIARDVDVPALWRLQAFDLACIAIGDNWTRANAVELMTKEEPEITFATLIHPRAVVADPASVGERSEERRVGK